MAPVKNPSVDYLRVYPGLNDFSDALEAIPQTVVDHLTHLKEIKAKSGSVAPDVGAEINSFFRERNPDKLRKIGAALERLLPAVGQKMHIAALAAEQVSHQLDRLNTDYKMICEHEVPENVQVDHHDPAFIEIVPQEKQASVRSQARREAREAREARRATQQQESRSSTPTNATEPQLHLVSRRRGRTATPQAPPNAANPAESTASFSNEATQPQPTTTHRNSNYNSTPRQSHQQEAAPEPEPKYEPESNSHDDSQNLKNGNGQLPPVVMPISGGVGSNNPGNNNNSNNSDSRKRTVSPSEEGGAEAMIGLKRKRGSAPKSSEPVYCYCQRGSFGEMVGCDGPHCEREWFHLDCIGLSALPKGQWFCEECRAKLRRR